MSEQTIETGLSPGAGMQLAPEATAQPTAKERLKEITAGIEKGIKELFASDQYAAYLKTMSKFHSYSLNNIMLIYMQKPDASLVAGFNRWRDQFQRHVLKGEKGIKIIAPAPYKKKLEREKRDPKTNLVMRDENNNPIKEEYEITIPMFRVTSVFDVSQTDGKPLPTISHELTASVEHFDALYEAVLRSSPVPIEMEAMADGQADGYFDLSKQRIAIREGMSESQTILAAIHEITHATLHNYDMKAAQEHPDPEKPPKDRRTMEVEAESVSYSVCSYYGIETGENSFGYIGNWSKNKELPELKASLETISNTASAIITNIDRNLQEIMQERNMQPLMTEYPGTAPETPAPEPQVSTSLSPMSRMMPDFSVTMRDLREYGYGDNDLLPMNKMKAMDLFDQDVPVYMVYPNGQAVMVETAEDIEKHSGYLGVEPADWKSSPDYADRLAKHDWETEQLEQFFLNKAEEPAIAIYQLRTAPEQQPYRFMSAKALETAGLTVERKNYEPIYTMSAPELHQDTERALGSVYEMFNVARPDDFRGHSLSTSDIVAIKREGQVSFHYVDNIGFKPLDHFLEPENPLKNAEMAMEDDANMIDGIINNGPKQDTKEPPSILAHLEKPLPREPKDPDRTAPKKEKGMEL